MANSREDLVRLIEEAVKGIKGKSVQRPAGTLAGHGAGLPFERLIHEELTRTFPGRAFRHFDALNKILGAHPETVRGKRLELLGPRSLAYLLRRGVTATQQWTADQQFEEKQNDTSDTIIFPDKELSFDGPVILVDGKSQDLEKKAQPPNIISAGKLAESCRLALEDGGGLPFDIVYVGVGWKKTTTALTCTSVHVASLAKISPHKLYINWVAAQQIQFHPSLVDQSFVGDGPTWVREYLATFCSQLAGRIEREKERLGRFHKALTEH